MYDLSLREKQRWTQLDFARKVRGLSAEQLEKLPEFDDSSQYGREQFAKLVKEAIR